MCHASPVRNNLCLTFLRGGGIKRAQPCDGNHGQNVMKYAYLLIPAAAMLLNSCDSAAELAAADSYAFKRDKSYTPAEAVNAGSWDAPAGITGAHVIVVDTELQKANYYIGNHLVGTSTVSSGKAGHGTPRGTFRVLAKDADHKSSSYGSIVDSAGNTMVADYTQGQPIPKGGHYKGAAMTNALQLTTGGVWMHEGIVTSAPESHGCIRLPKKMAKIFFDNTSVGDTVIIK